MEMKFNLKVLMAERDLDYITLSKEVNIDRNMLSAIANNKVQNLKIKHINTLLNYFKCPVIKKKSNMEMKFNLKVLMAERDLDYITLSKEVNIDRNMLSAIANNKVQNLKIKHINTLLNYFKCPVEKFFLLVPEKKQVNK